MLTYKMTYCYTLVNSFCDTACLPKTQKLSTNKADGWILRDLVAFNALGSPEHLKDLVVVLWQLDQARLLPVWIYLKKCLVGRKK